MRLSAPKKALLLGLVIGLCVSVLLIPLSMRQASQASIQTVNDRDYYSTVHSEFQNAQESIHVVLYGSKYYTSSKGGHVNQLLEDLGDAAKRGLDVKVVLDEEWGDDSVKAVIYLKSLGVDAIFDSERVRTHSKFIVIDGYTVIVGSTNWSDSAVDSNHEANVLIRSEEIGKEFERYFSKIWNER